MQVMIIEFARSILKYGGANSSEFAPGCAHPVVDLMDEQREITNKGGTMRLGGYPCLLVEGTKVRAAYGVERISERHRHRYEINNHYRKLLEDAGMVWSGVSPDGRLVEIAEVRDHPWMIGSQFHPEFKSRPNAPHPLFRGFLAAACARSSQS
jgi:CTP synthase